MTAMEIVWEYLYEPTCRVHDKLRKYYQELMWEKTDDPAILRERRIARSEIRRANERIEFMIEKHEPVTYARAMMEKDAGSAETDMIIAQLENGMIDTGRVSKRAIMHTICERKDGV